MIKYRFLLIEDSDADRQTLFDLLKQVSLLVQVDTCASAIEAMPRLFTQQYDLIFLDMRLPGLSGLDWLRAAPHRPPVIITTAFPDFAVDSYDLDVADYLLKPLTLPRLQRAINRALTVQVSERSITEQNSIYLYVDRRLQQFRFEDMRYFEAYGAYTKIHGVEGFVTVNESISLIQERLPDRQFMRIHKSFVVNLDKLTAIGHRQVWIGDVKLPVGAQQRELMRQLVNRVPA